MHTKKLLAARSGFTLIEIMLVVIIITILASLVVPRFAGQSQKARVAAAQAQISSLGVALDMYELHNGSYPSTEQGLEALRVAPSSDPAPADWQGPYMKKDIPLDPWKHPYVYVSPGEHNPETYDLYSRGPDGQDGGGDDVTNWEQ